MKLSLFSISYAGYRDQDKAKLSEFTVSSAGLGCDSVMLVARRPHLSPLDTDADCVASVKQSPEVNNIERDGITDFEMCSPVRGEGSIENRIANSAHYINWMQERFLM